MTTLNGKYIHLMNDQNIDAKFCFLKRYLIKGSKDQFVSMNDLKEELSEIEFRVLSAKYVSIVVSSKKVSAFTNY